MAYEPITGMAFQYQKENGGFASYFYIKFYASGTNTPILAAPNSTATDDLGNELLLDKIRLNEKGYPVNPSGGVIVPHLDQKYKIALFRTAADADGDLTNNAEWVVDGLAPGLLGFVDDDGGINSNDVVYVYSGSATETNVGAKLRERVSVKDFGAVGDGVADDSTAFSTALLSGNNIYVPEGTYLVGGIIVQTNQQSLHFDNNVTFMANANDVVLFKQVSSYSRHSGGMVEFDANGYTGVWGVQCGPSDLTQTTTLTNQVQCTMPSIKGTSGIVELAVVQCGPEVGSTDSKNEHNIWPNILTNDAVRGMWFKDSVHSIAGQSRAHTIQNFYAGGQTNTGVEINSGSDNDFVVFQAESLTNGGSPNSTATAIKIHDDDSVTGTDNVNNRFNAGYITGCSRDVDNNSPTSIFALTWDVDNSQISQRPFYVIPSPWKSSTPSTSGLTDGVTFARVRYFYLHDNVTFICTIRTGNGSPSNIDRQTLTVDMPFSVDSQHRTIDNAFPVTGTAYNNTSEEVMTCDLYGYFSDSNTITIANVPRWTQIAGMTITFGTLTFKST